MFRPSIAQILKVMADKGYKVYSTKPYDLNIVGIRARNSRMNVFDDTIVVLYKNETDQWEIKYFQATTLAGEHWMLNPMRKEGTAIVLENQYLGVYKKGTHNKSRPSASYPALEQIKPMLYVRDGNRDKKYDIHNEQGEPIHKSISYEIAYTNLHRAAESGWSKFVDKWSAGCQVITGIDPETGKPAWETFMKLVDLQIESGLGSIFTYTLLNEKDFD